MEKDKTSKTPVNMGKGRASKQTPVKWNRAKPVKTPVKMEKGRASNKNTCVLDVAHFCNEFLSYGP